MSDTQTLTITAIPRASIISSVSATYLGSNATISINSKSSSFTHKVWYRVNGGSWVDVGDVRSFVPALSYASLNTLSDSNTLDVCLRTYSGGSSIGNDDYSYGTIIKTPKNSSTLPSAGSFSTSELYPSVINSGLGVYIQGWSKIRISHSGASAKFGATIKKIEIFFDGKVVGTKTPTDIIYPTVTGSRPIYVKVTDSRGFTATTSTSNVYIYPYTEPDIKSVYPYRDNGGTAATAKVSFTSTITKIKANKHLVRGWFTEDNGVDNWTKCFEKLYTSATVTETISLSGYTFDLTKGYKFWFETNDSITDDKQVSTIPSADVIMAYGRKSVGIGMIPDETHRLDIRGRTHITGLPELLRLENDTHAYISTYVGGERRAWVGFGDVGSKDYRISNEYAGTWCGLLGDGTFNVSGKGITFGGKNIGDLGDNIWGTYNSTNGSAISYSWTDHRSISLGVGVWIISGGYTVGNQVGKYMDWEVSGLPSGYTLGGVLYCQDNNVHSTNGTIVVPVQSPINIVLRAWTSNGMSKVNSHFLTATKLVSY